MKHIGLRGRSIKNSLWAYIREGLAWERFFHLRFGGLFSGELIHLIVFRGKWEGGYYHNFTVSRGRYAAFKVDRWVRLKN